MHKQLKMSKPIMTSYPKFANLLSILADHPNFQNWLYLNHIQLQGDYNPDIFWVDFYQPLSRKHYPLIERQALRRASVVNNRISIHDFIMKSIDNDGYIYIRIDTFYISAYKNHFQKEHFPHDMFIYGYDDEKEVFFVADFFTGSYALAETRFTELEAAFYSPYISSCPELMDLQILTVLHNEQFQFDKDRCIKLLYDYVNSVNTSKEFSLIQQPLDDNKFFFGLGIYEPLKEYILFSGHSFSITRALHVLYDHKKLMHHRISFLIETNQLIESSSMRESFHDLEMRALTIRNMYIKYTLSKKTSLISTLITYLNHLMSSEEKIITELINQLQD